MNLQQGLQQLADDLGLNTADLIAYAAEDQYGGVDMGWPMGSIYAGEGQILYALARSMKPAHAIEIGTWRGCSATHLLAALKANSFGTLTSVDPIPDAGADIPSELWGRWSFVNGYGQIYMEYVRPPAELIFEDGPHDTEETAHILEVARDICHPRLIISHDGLHRDVGPKIRAAYQRVFGSYRTLLIDPSEAGFVYEVLP